MFCYLILKYNIYIPHYWFDNKTQLNIMIPDQSSIKLKTQQEKCCNGFKKKKTSFKQVDTAKILVNLLT